MRARENALGLVLRFGDVWGGCASVSTRRWLPFIGWYRNWVCEDIFVRRSFKQDEKAIRRRIEEFRATDTKLMLFLSPEGMIVDRNKIGRLYTENCRQFCRDQAHEKKPSDDKVFVDDEGARAGLPGV